jgi:replication factor C subunit 3/5
MVHKIKSEHKEFKASATSSTIVECVVFSSNFHIEVTPSDADSQDRVIVQKLIKEIAGTQQFNTSVQKSFKVVVIHELDNLTREAQAALRRTMETYMPYCRIVANCESLSKVILPLRSRCLQIRVPAPSTNEVVDVLTGISKREGFNLPKPLAYSICNFSKRNLRRAIMML